MLDKTNNSPDTTIFDPKEILGVIGLRSLGYYKIKQNTIQQHLGKYYRFKRADTLCEQLNKFINMLKKETPQE